MNSSWNGDYNIFFDNFMNSCKKIGIFGDFT